MKHYTVWAVVAISRFGADFIASAVELAREIKAVGKIAFEGPFQSAGVSLPSPCRLFFGFPSPSKASSWMLWHLSL
jgi:hypothetical protein